MKELVQRIAALPRKDYDKKIFTLDEIGKKINSEIARNLKLCEEFNLRGADILASEIIHSKDELATLQKEKPSFREQNKNDERVGELRELIIELEALLVEKGEYASRLQSHKIKQDQHDKSVEILQPLANKLKEIEKELKDNFADIQVLEASHISNPLGADTFRLMEAMARPSGVFN